MGCQRQGGHTLYEMLIVVAIISLVASIAVPSSNSTQLYRLNQSSSEVADAFRFARDESQRSGVSHGVSVDVTTNSVRVFRLDEGPDPNTKIFDVRHPVTKQFYSIQFSGPGYVGVELSNHGGQIVGSCVSSGDITFDATGIVRCSEPTSTRFINASVELTAGEATKNIAIDGYTGRVSVQ